MAEQQGQGVDLFRPFIVKTQIPIGFTIYPLPRPFEIERKEAAAASPPVPVPVSEKKEEEKLCVICLERPITQVFFPCGHEACCEPCAASQVGKPCPMCRTPIKEQIRVFKV